MLAQRAGDGTFFSPYSNDASGAVSGFFGDAFKVVPQSPAGMFVRLRAGVGFFANNTDVPTNIGGVANLNDQDPYKPLALQEIQTIAVPAADPTNPRIDIVEVTYDRRVQDPSSRDIFTASAPFQFVAASVNKILAWIGDGRVSIDPPPYGVGLAKINYKVGVPAALPAAPAVTAGYTKIAEVRVGATVTSLDETVIKDLRRVIAPYGQHRVSVHAQIPNAAAAATLYALNAPPGTVVALQNAGVGTLGAVLYVVLGALPKDVSVQAYAYETLLPANNFSQVRCTPPTIGALSSVDATAINTAAPNLAPTGAKVAEGQPAIKINFDVKDKTGGAAAATDPFVCFEVTFRQ